LSEALASFHSGVQYANPWHPNAITSLRNADIDGVVELVGHVRAENPGNDVRWLHSDDVSANDLTGHVILVGGGDQVAGRTGGTGPLQYWRDRLDLPFRTETSVGGDIEYDSYFVLSVAEDGSPRKDGTREEHYAPRFALAPDGERVVQNGEPQIEYDVALFARQVNPLNQSATVTICTGIFSRGSYGAVRALTDASLRGRNERYLYEHYDMKSFWLLMHVPVFPGPHGAQTVTPDLTRLFHRIRSSS
jgi:hypothetical protein